MKKRSTIGKPTVVVNNKAELEALLKKTFRYYGRNCDLNFIDVSKVTDMYQLFFGLNGSPDISKWDVSHVKNMNAMFMRSSFNGDLSGWDTSSVETMAYMFCEADFNGDISKWNLSSVKNLDGMFQQSWYFDQDISGWDVSKVEDMSYMFQDAREFKRDLSGWNPKYILDHLDGTYKDGLKSTFYCDINYRRKEMKGFTVLPGWYLDTIEICSKRLGDRQ